MGLGFLVSRSNRSFSFATKALTSVHCLCRAAFTVVPPFLASHVVTFLPQNVARRATRRRGSGKSHRADLSSRLFSLIRPLVTRLRRARASLAPMGSHGLHHRSTRFDHLALDFSLSRRMATDDGIPWKPVRTSVDGWRRVRHGLFRKDGRVGARLG